MSELEIDLSVVPKTTMSICDAIKNVHKNEVEYNKFNIDNDNSDIIDYKQLYIDENNIGFKKLELKYNLNREKQNRGSYIINMNYFSNIDISYFKNEILKTCDNIKDNKIEFICRNISKEYLFDKKDKDVNIIPAFIGFKYNTNTVYYFNDMIYIHKSILDKETEYFHFITSVYERNLMLNNIMLKLTSEMLEFTKNNYGYWW